MTEETAPEETGQAEESAPAPEGQAKETTWFSGAEEETIGYIQNKGWTDDPMKAVEAYKNLEKFHGVSEDKLIKLPKDGEPLDPVYDRLGRPESPDKYEINLPDGTQIDESYVNGAKELAYKIGLNNEQMQALAEYQATFEAQAMQEMQKQTAAQQEADLKALEKEWGKAFEERAELGRRFIKNNLPDDADKGALLDAIEAAIGTANTLRLFGNAGQKFAQDSVPQSEGDRPFGYTPQQALADKQALMNELKADPARLANYNRQVGPDYEKMQRIIKMSAG